MNDKKIRLLIVDDHDLIRVGLNVLLSTCADLELVGDTGSGAEAVRLYDELRPDVVLLDLIMPGMDGIAVARAIRDINPDARIIALTNYNEEELIQRALQSGVISYLLKNITLNELSRAIHAAYKGIQILAEETTQTLAEVAARPPAPGYNLTQRELDVLKLLARGLNNNEIAQQIYISPSTVKKHVSNILTKLNANSRTEAVALALQHKIVNY